jgi:hypothetical protein
MASEPSFPAELEREIFEATASMHPSAIPTLLRVARRTLIWYLDSLLRYSPQSLSLKQDRTILVQVHRF